MIKRLLLAAALLLASCAWAQVPAANVAAVPWRSIGPAATGGRIADFAVASPPGAAEIMYVGTATGGVFKSSNAGVSWSPIFDHAGGMLSIGAVAVAPSNPNIVWVGTGEVDNRQSSSWGNGIFRSLDGGRTWQNMGLAETRHIAKILVDPTNANIVYVAALGHLWGSNPERGVYKTTDGGRSWSKVLYKDENTGATDLAMSASDPNVLFAAMYQRQRKGWGFNGGGPGSGLYRTSDGGRTWTELGTSATAGLPAGDKGRIGVALNPTNPSLVYAIVEADPAPPAGRGGRSGGAPPAARRPQPLRGGIFRSLDQGQTWEHLSTLDPRPSYYSRIYLDPKDPNRVYIMGSERGFYISDDGGRNFRDVFSQVHGEDHAMWVDPANPDHLLIGGDGGVSISYDRGQTWLFRNNLPIGQFYDISTDSGSPYLICGGLQDNGNWCTPSATNLSLGLSNRDAFNVGGGDGMQAIFDGDNQTLLVSSQNGNTTRLDLPSMQRQSITAALPPAPGARPTAPGAGLRYYWTAPLLVSHFSPKVIYTGANILFRSPDQGVTWEAISPDLTAHVNRDTLSMMGGPIPANALSKNDGQDNFSALTAIAESPLNPKVLYTGADDGTLQITRDGGGHWTNLTKNLPGVPPLTNVSGIVASQYAAGRVYVTLDGHFNDDYRPYVLVSDDYGASWRSITAGLPATSVHRLRENPSNQDFLVAGLEMGVYASWDRGAHWTPLNTDLPPVPVYDLVYQATTNDLVLGTHGRGIWILDHAAGLAALTPAEMEGPARLLPPPPTARQTIYTPQAWYGAGEFFAPNPPTGMPIEFYLPAAPAASDQATLSISDAAGAPVRSQRVPVVAGFNRVYWDLHYAEVGGARPNGPGGGRGGASGPFAAPGRYRLALSVDGQPPSATMTEEIEVAPDPESHLSPAQERTREASVLSAYRLQQQLEPASAAAATAARELAALRTFSPAAQAAAAQLAPLAAEVARSLAQAAGAERAMDSYPGLPTANQLLQLDAAWQSAIPAVAALNRFLEQRLPPIAWQPPAPVALPVRH